jgi:cyanophycinase
LATSNRRLKLVAKPSPNRARRGALIAIGGAEDKVGDRAVLATLVERSGAAGGAIALFPTASKIPNELARTYRAAFAALGVETRVIRVEKRLDAADPDRVGMLRGVKAAFFTGGDQGRLISLLGGTPMVQAIRRAFADGMTVAGTSAGASALCAHMIAQGRRGYAPKRLSVTMAPGFGLTKRLVVDQHFAQRHRIGRLFAAVALNPFLIGVGIDENTAAVVDGYGRLEVVGDGTVTIVDGAHLLHTNIHATGPVEPAAVLGLSVHLLPARHGYNIDARTPLWPEEASPEEPDELRKQELRKQELRKQDKPQPAPRSRTPRAGQARPSKRS